MAEPRRLGRCSSLSGSQAQMDANRREQNVSVSSGSSERLATKLVSVQGQLKQCQMGALWREVAEFHSVGSLSLQITEHSGERRAKSL